MGQDVQNFGVDLGQAVALTPVLLNPEMGDKEKLSPLIPDDATWVLVSLNRSLWKQFKSTAKVIVTQSNDGGKSYFEIGGFECQCGPCFFNDEPVNEISTECALKKGTGRFVSATVEFSGEPAETSISIKAG